MYKIYINENALILTDSQSVREQKYTNKSLKAPYSGKSKMLLSYIDMLEKTNRFQSIIIHYHDYQKLKSDFLNLFVIKKAAGGLVINEFGQGLFIHRRGYWDLPKGKKDLGEKSKATAVREVKEETGVSQLILKQKLLTTKHTYRVSNNKRAIKKTKWYLMEAPKQKLVPQTEEDIIKAEWRPINLEQFSDVEIYKNIIDVVNSYLNESLKHSL